MKQKVRGIPMDLTLLIFTDGNWIEGKKFGDFDIILMIDPSEKAVYYWEGPRAGPIQKSEARDALGTIKTQYSSFKLKRIEPEKIPERFRKSWDKMYNPISEQYVPPEKFIKPSRILVLISALWILAGTLLLILDFSNLTGLSALMFIGSVFMLGATFFQWRAECYTDIIWGLAAVFIIWFSVFFVWNGFWGINIGNGLIILSIIICTVMAGVSDKF